MRLRLDPWPAEYDAPLQISADDVEDTFPESVDPTVESPGWQAIPGSARAAECAFVDGVRRVEARVLSDGPGALVHGLFGAAAAGWVLARPAQAGVTGIRLERLLVMGSRRAEVAPIELDCGSARLRYGLVCTDENHPHGVLAALQSRMRALEAAVAGEVAAQGICVFVDGLSYRATGSRDVVGVVKRLLSPYVDEARLALLPRLKEGERTPLFLLANPVYPRYSCFLRLASPAPVMHALAGVARIEMGAAGGIEAAVRLANLAAATLPAFASPWHWDGRAPQNLAPVAALEQELRRRMGDALLIRRAIERTLWDEQRDR